MNLSKLWETVKYREDWHRKVHGGTTRHYLGTEQQQVSASHAGGLWHAHTLCVYACP